MQFDEWRVMIARTVDGMILADVSPSALPTFSCGLNDAGSWGVTVQLDDPNNRHVDFRTYATSVRFSWVICYGDTVVQAGPVTTYGIDDEARTLTLGGVGIGGLFKRRVLLNPDGHTAIVDPSNDIPYEGEHKWEVLRRMVAYGMGETGYVLPIDLPAQFPTAHPNGTKGTYYGYDLAMVWERMEQLSQTNDGPEFYFAPKLNNTGTQLRWDLKVGTPLLGNQSSLAVWDYGGALSTINIDGDGSAATVTRAWSKGDGTDRGLKTGFAEDTSLFALGYPGLDYVDSDHTSVVVQQTMEDYADAALESFRWPLETWEADVRIDGANYVNPGVEVSPSLGNWQLGDAPQFGIVNHLWIPDGSYRRRITAFQNSTTETVKLTIQEEVAV